MGKEIAQRVHDADGGFLVFNTDMHMQAEDQIRASHQLQIFDDLRIAGIGMDLLRAPVRERMCRAGDQH